MGLFGALFTGVSGVGSQSQKTAIISNNIANVNTTGFKRSEASFFSLVTTANRSSRFSPGTVSANRIQRVDEQGSISQSTSSTDASVSGNGMFAVKRDSDDSALTEFLYTRNGQFSENAEGFLVNSAGFFLYGWPLDSQGNLPANQGDLESLVPVDVAFLSGLTRPTNTAELAVNLDAGEPDTLLANTGTAAVDFQRGLTVFDSLGNGQDITFEFIKTYGPHATVAGTVNNLSGTTDFITDLGLSDGDTFDLSVDGGPATTYEIDDGGGVGAGNTAIQTIGDFINDINANITDMSAFIGNSGELILQHDDFTTGTETFTITDGVGAPLSAIFGSGGPLTDTSDNLDGGATPPSYGNFDNGAPGDSPPYSTESFPTFANLPGSVNYNTRGWWNIQIKDPSNNVLTRGLLNFNGDGTINALEDSSGNIDINLTQIDWGNGSEPQNLDIDVSRFSQFASDFTVLFSDQDGAELGLRTGVQIDRDGFVIAQFSNGANSQLYKLPLVTFANVNGLNEVSGTAYTETSDSGEENLREAGTGGAGFLEPSTRENSNVDLADEFAKLIVAQRAFSASTKIITTADEMLRELMRLR